MVFSPFAISESRKPAQAGDQADTRTTLKPTREATLKRASGGGTSLPSG
jgi:hypothetical protein